MVDEVECWGSGSNPYEDDGHWFDIEGNQEVIVKYLIHPKRELSEQIINNIANDVTEALVDIGQIVDKNSYIKIKDGKYGKIMSLNDYCDYIKSLEQYPDDCNYYKSNQPILKEIVTDADNELIEIIVSITFEFYLHNTYDYDAPEVVEFNPNIILYDIDASDYLYDYGEEGLIEPIKASDIKISIQDI